MAENPKEWPRVHTCLNDWCPEQSDDCERCNKVLSLIRGHAEMPVKNPDQQSEKGTNE